jgi:hypothetical protein
VSVGRIARYRITISRTRPNIGLRNVLVVSTQAGRQVGRWRLATLAPGRKRTLRLALRVPAGARGSFCINTRATARNARAGSVRYCTPVRRP